MSILAYNEYYILLSYIMGGKRRRDLDQLMDDERRDETNGICGESYGSAARVSRSSLICSTESDYYLIYLMTLTSAYNTI